MTDVATPQQPTRKAGRRGNKHPIVHVPELRLKLFKTGQAVPPPEGDVTQGRTDWGMDDNDRLGCCGPAATDHNVMAKIGPSAQPNQLGGVGVDSLYFRYGKSMGEAGDQPDQGVDNATWLKFLFDLGIIEGFAELDKDDLNEVRQAMLDYRGVICGLQLTDDAEADFEATPPVPWQVTPADQPDPAAGHDTLLVKYNPTGGTLVTWGGLQDFLMDFETGGGFTDCWVILTKEDAARTGVDLAALQDKIRAWGGVVKPPPAPAPAPAPGNTPLTPSPAPIPPSGGPTPTGGGGTPPPAPEPSPDVPDEVEGLLGRIDDILHAAREEVLALVHGHLRPQS